MEYPGVKAIITGRDMPVAQMENPSRAAQFDSDNVMAREKVLYKGHPLAAVAAINPHVAETALHLIDVEYEVLPPVMNVRDSIKDSAPLLHDDLTTTELGEQTDEHSNVANHFRYEQKDVEKGFAEADLVVEREFTNATVHQGYIEPQNGVAVWNSDGQVTVWTSTQGAFMARDKLGPILDLPVSRIKVVPMEIGGGFGGKITV